MKYSVDVLKDDDLVVVWNFRHETVFIGYTKKLEWLARFKSNAKIGMWKLKNLNNMKEFKGTRGTWEYVETNHTQRKKTSGIRSFKCLR